MALNYLSKMTFKQVEALKETTDIAFFPLGPTEAHGPHLPLMVDIVSANEITERAARKLKSKNIETLIAPTLPYALADISNSFPGNITVRYETVAAIIEDVCLGLAKWGFNKIVIISGHAGPGNMQAIKEGIKRAKGRNENLKIIVSNWYLKGLPKIVPLCKEEHPQWDFHAGEWETALMLLRHPELVDYRELNKLEPNWEGKNFLQRAAAGKKDWLDLGAPLAYFGDPRKADKETAEKVYDVFSDIVVEEVLELL